MLARALVSNKAVVVGGGVGVGGVAPRCFAAVSGQRVKDGRGAAAVAALSTTTITTSTITSTSTTTTTTKRSFLTTNHGLTICSLAKTTTATAPSFTSLQRPGPQRALRPAPQRHPDIQQAAPYSSTATMSSATTFFDFKPKDKRGNPFPLSPLAGKVILVVNTASKCGFTPQFSALETLYQKIQTSHPNAFEILGFPCDQFGHQDPGSNDTIQEFCQVNYGVTFTVLGKTEVNGDEAEPVWEWMKGEKKGLMGMKRIKWNFEKFLIGKDGKVINRWASMTKPEALEEAVLEALKA